MQRAASVASETALVGVAALGAGRAVGLARRAGDEDVNEPAHVVAIAVRQVGQVANEYRSRLHGLRFHPTQEPRCR